MNILLHDGTEGIGGSKLTCLETSLALHRQGHNLRIIGKQEQSILFQSPDVIPCLVGPDALLTHYEWADIVLVHFPMSWEAIKYSQETGKPRVHFVCNLDSPQILKLEGAALLVFNSYWLMASTKWDGNKIMVYPPVYPNKFRTKRGNKLLLVSPFKLKGIDLFVELARRLPEKEFVIAKGSTWAEECLADLPDNIEVMERCIDAREIYSHARLVLMPSRSGDSKRWNWCEGYGRTAIEAACSGIPTIASRESIGLRECLGRGGMFCGQDNVDEWVGMIRRLDNKNFYKEESIYALKLAKERYPDKQIKRLERKLLAICNRI